MDPQHFRKVMGHFVSGVTVVTGPPGSDEPFGLTASSFISVSLNPLLVLVSVGLGSASLPRLLDAGAFAVNVLSSSQDELAWRFAGADRGGRFVGIDWSPGTSTGSPLLAGAVAWFECRLWRTVEAGDHVLLLGEVVACEAPGADPLVYFRAGFHRLTR